MPTRSLRPPRRHRHTTLPRLRPTWRPRGRSMRGQRRRCGQPAGLCGDGGAAQGILRPWPSNANALKALSANANALNAFERACISSRRWRQIRPLQRPCRTLISRPACRSIVQPGRVVARKGGDEGGCAGRDRRWIGGRSSSASAASATGAWAQAQPEPLPPQPDTTTIEEVPDPVAGRARPPHTAARTQPESPSVSRQTRRHPPDDAGNRQSARCSISIPPRPI